MTLRGMLITQGSYKEKPAHDNGNTIYANEFT